MVSTKDARRWWHATDNFMINLITEKSCKQGPTVLMLSAVGITFQNWNAFPDFLLQNFMKISQSLLREAFLWDAQLQSPFNHKLGVFIFVAWIRRILAGHAETYCKHLWIKARVAVRKGWRFISAVQRVWIKLWILGALILLEHCIWHLYCAGTSKAWEITCERSFPISSEHIKA